MKTPVKPAVSSPQPQVAVEMKLLKEQLSEAQTKLKGKCLKFTKLSETKSILKKIKFLNGTLSYFYLCLDTVFFVYISYRQMG